MDKEYIAHTELGEDVVFHNPHGFILLPWQREVVMAKQETRVMICGYGSGKSLGYFAGMLWRACTLPGYRALVLGPYSLQANELYDQGLILMESTLLKDRFLTGSPKRPYAQLKFHNDLVGHTSISFIGIGDEIGKIKNLTVDEILVDQAEMIDDFDALFHTLGSRMRGQVQGRERLGYLTFSANSEDNPQLWEVYDEAEEDTDGVQATSVTTFDNPYITPRQYVLIEKRMGKSATDKDQRLRGSRPRGAGEHFPLESINAIHATWLDDMMEEHLKAGDEGYKLEERPKASVVLWETPPQPGGTYLTLADPGWANPPYRNSPAIMVWNIADFPNSPAILAAFAWVYGNNSPDPWIDKFIEYVYRYETNLRCAFDATAWQSGYDKWVFSLEKIHAEKMSMAGGTKYDHLNSARILTSRGLIQVPKIPMLFTQMTKYRLPDTKIRQDLVAVLTMSCGWLQRMFWNELENAEDDSVPITRSRHQRRDNARHSVRSRRR
jgi:hypothetical protein